MQEAGEVEQETTDLVQLLTSRQTELASMLNGFPRLRSTIWISEASQQAAVQSLTPQMTENRGKACIFPCHSTPCGGRQQPMSALPVSTHCALLPLFCKWLRL